MTVEVLIGDCHKVPLASDSIDCIIASPSYWGVLGYGCPGQVGQAETVTEYVSELGKIFLELRRVLKPTGVLWFISGDNHPSFRGVPWMTVLSLMSSGWYMHREFIWDKVNKGQLNEQIFSHDYVFLMSKELMQSFLIPTHSVWHYPEEPAYPGALFKPLPIGLVENCLRYGTPPYNTVFNPFSGSGTVGLVCAKQNQSAILLDLDSNAAMMARTRLDKYHHDKN